MKLLFCHIENFGKIHDFSVDFSDGMHVINEPNAWGKSTLAAFIKVMFYGFDAKKEIGAFDKERNIYRPWQGGIYGGELEFEISGQRYLISRTFGKSEKADEFHLYDCRTNLECRDYSENIGEELFDLDAASFKRSIFIAQKDCASQTTDAINAKLGNLVENTNDINNYETAQEYLKDLANRLSPNRATGSIKKRRNQMTAIEHELHSYEAAEAAIVELRQKQQLAIFNKDSLQRQRDTYTEQLKEASEESRKQELRRVYLGLCEEQEEKLSALVPYTEFFPAGMPDEALLAAQIKKARKLEEDQNTLLHMDLTPEEREHYAKLQIKFRKGLPEDGEIDGYLDRLKELSGIRDERMRVEMKISEKEHESFQRKEPEIKELPKLSAGAVLGIIFVALGVAAEIFGILNIRANVYGIWLTLGGALLFVAGILTLVLGIRSRAKHLEAMENARKEWEESQRVWREEVEALQQEEKGKALLIQKICGDTESFLSKFLIYPTEAEYATSLVELKTMGHEYAKISAKLERYKEFREEVYDERDALMKYGIQIGRRFTEDITESLNAIATEAAKYRMAKEHAAAAQAKVKAFEEANNMAKLLQENRKLLSIGELNDKIKRLDAEIEELRAGIEQYGRQIEDLEEQLDLRDEKETELSDLAKMQEREQQLYDTVILTQDILQRAKEQFTARYMAPISNAFRKYYNMLVGMAEDDSWQIDANISLQLREQGEFRETKWLSAGYQDLIGVCMRFALVDAMYQGEKPFLILDDPFVNLDEAKTLRGMQLLLTVADEYQILYFTCHSSREPQAALW